MYDKVSANQNFVEREQKIEKFWADNMIFEKSIELRQHSPEFTFYDGPPTANGKPHIGHVLTRVIKDMIPRYKTMKGYKVPRKAGWDTHGLRVELEVEKITVWNRLSSIVRTASGNTKACGKNSPMLLVSGQIWSIRMLRTTTTISNPNGGH